MSTKLPETHRDPAGEKPRIALVGPRRIRQGLGPYFARSVLRHGARLAAFACSRESSLEVAARELQGIVGHDVAGYVGVEAMLDADHGIDALIIASPVPTHEAALESALEHGVAVLCEKPFLAPEAGAVERAMQLCAGFYDRGLPLMIHAQWPETLPSYRALFPDVFETRPLSFRMELAPGSVGIDALVDSIPHPLSLLQAVAGEENVEHASIERIEIDDLGSAGSETKGHVHVVRFDWSCPGMPDIECRIDLAHRAAQPRPAGYGFDGCFAAREVEQPDYQMFFRDCEPALGPGFGSRRADSTSPRRVLVPDPLDQRVGSFLAALEKPVDRAAAFLPAHRMRMLSRILDAYPSSHVD